MALIQYKPILEIPSKVELFEGCLRIISLEDALREHFGEKSVDRFRDYDLRIEAPINTGFALQLQCFPGDHLISQEGKTHGRMYSCSGESVSGVEAKDVSVEHFSALTGSTGLALKLDLNPNQQFRYLKLTFSFPQYNHHLTRFEDRINSDSP